MDEHEYTKHYYIEGERVCSKIGGGFGPADVLPTSTPLNFIVGDETDCSENLFALTKRFVLCTGYSGNWEISHTLQPAYNTEHNFEDKQYFYHPDHLGSSSFITNALGRAEQHLQYLPFGELWINQRNSEFDSPYKFSAKELDSESGYNYFGARYYDSEASIWLSVDPMADVTPRWSPYSYCFNNPIMFIDPMGLTGYKVNGEIKQIDDGHDNIVMTVNSRQFRKANRKFKNGNGYEKYRRKLENKCEWLSVRYDFSNREFNTAGLDKNAIANLDIEISLHNASGSDRDWDQIVQDADEFLLAASMADAQLPIGDAVGAGAAISARLGKLFFGAARSSTSAARLSSNGVKLTQQLASEAQLSQAGRTIIRNLRSGPRLAQQYGGRAADWVKKSSSSFSKNGKTFETHWYQNVSTGQRVEFKTKLIQGW
jgi:RHS repeat-associated protein